MSEIIEISFFRGVQNEKKTDIECGCLMMILPLLSGCWTMAAAGAGAYGGYKMKEEGYTVQNPVTKEKEKEKKPSQ